MLAIVHRVQRFHTYLYGHEFTIITDHEPFVTICSKRLHAAPSPLQGMLLKIQGYDYNIHYGPDKALLLADAMSRLPNPNSHCYYFLSVNKQGVVRKKTRGQCNVRVERNHS